MLFAVHNENHPDKFWLVSECGSAQITARLEYTDEWVLWSLIVDPQSRGEGLGDEALMAGEDVVRSLGVSEVYLKVYRDRWMYRWYERRGYVEAENSHTESFVALMVKDLSLTK